MLVIQAFCQDNEKIHLYFESDTIKVEQDNTFSNFIVLENLSNQDIEIQNLNPKINYPGLLLGPESSFTIKAGMKRRMLIKFVANLSFMKMKEQSIQFELNYSFENQNKLISTSFFIQRQEEKNITLFSYTPENYLDPNLPKPTISLYVKNRGYAPRSIKIVSNAQSAGIEVINKEQIVYLEAQEQKKIELELTIHQKQNFFPDNRIQVTAIDLVDNQNVGNTSLKVVVLTNNRQIVPNVTADPNKNAIELGYNQMNGNFSNLQLRGNSSFYTGNNIQGKINTVIDYFPQENAFNLYDTYLELEKKQYKLKMGNVYGDDYDYSASGRGAKLNVQVSKTNSLEVIATENKYNLWGNYYKEIKGSTIIGAKYYLGDQNFKTKISYLFDHNPNLLTNTNLTNIVSSFSIDSIHQFRLEGGLSHEEGLILKDNSLGGTLGINYNSKIGKFDFNSSNIYSTNHYAGQKRGSSYFNETIGFRTSIKSKLFLQYNYAVVEPQYLSYQNESVLPGVIQEYPYYYNEKNYIATGFQFSKKLYNLTISPRMEKQKYNTTMFDEELIAYRLRVEASTNFSNQSLTLSTEYGYSKALSKVDWFQNFETNLSYRSRGFSISIQYRLNPSDVWELNSVNQNKQNVQYFSIYPSYSFHTIGNKLIGNISAGLSYSELYDNLGKNINGNIEYKISPTWSGTAYGNYSNYKSNTYSGNNYQVRIGVKKYFINATAPGNHKITLQFFHDKNFNGIRDNNEDAIVNEVIQINEFKALTDKNGKVVFLNVPDGTYHLKLNEHGGLKLMIDPNIIINKNKTLKIGLIKDNKVSGKLIEIKQKYDDQETNVTGIIVYAKDEKGNITSTVADQNNYFEFFLKNGNYEIYIENDKYLYIDPIKKVSLANGDYKEDIIFEYKKKNKEIKVKKF